MSLFDAFISQTVSGISYTTYSSNPTLYSSTLIDAIAACMTGVTPSMISSFTAAASSRRLAEQMSMQIAEIRVLSSGSIVISYVVTTNSPTLTYSTMTSQLDAATSGTAFTTNLNYYAAVNNAPALNNCTSSTPVTADITPVTTSGGGDDDNSLSGGAIAGIVIGTLVGAAIIGFLVYYFALGGNGGGSSGGAARSDKNVSMDSNSSGSGATYQKKKAPMTENPVFGISAIASPKKGGKGGSAHVDDSNM